MKKPATITMLTAFFSCIVFYSSCKKGCTDVKASNYSAKAKKDDGSCVYFQDNFLPLMLSDIGNGIILPRYAAMADALENLNSSVVAFSGSVTTENLTDVQAKLKSAELAWQKCATFEFGPAEEKSLRSHVNTFPTDTATIEEKIQSGSYDLTSFLAVGYKGLPAIDYLVNSGTNDDVVLKFQNSANRVNFLVSVVATLKSELGAVYNGWLATGDNYIKTFVESKGSDVSSSLSLLVNQFNYDYELIKNAKIGIPLGKQTLGNPLPEQTEAYYGKISSELAQKAINGIYDLYLGVSESGEDKNGLDDYLINNKSNVLSGEIKTQFQSAISAMEVVPDPMSETIVNNQGIVDVAYEEIKKLVILIKTDMSTEMEVSITYSDGDGD